MEKSNLQIIRWDEEKKHSFSHHRRKIIQSKSYLD